MELVLVLAAVLASALAFGTVHFATPPLIRRLERSGSVVVDVLKPGRAMVARPGGPALAAGLLAGEAVLYALIQAAEIPALMATTLACFVVGYVDDRKVMGGWFKPVALALAAAPMLLLGAYDSEMALPIFGSVSIPLLYLALAPLMICVTGNTANSIDVMNGLLSGFMVIAGAALAVSLVIVQNYTMAAAVLPLVMVSLAYYRYHKIPCRIFPGDSGALVLGGMYGAVAIAGGVEMVAAVALLPAIINSFLYLAGTKRIMEYRHLKKKSVICTDDFRVKDSGEKGAPLTLVGLIAGRVPHTEGQVVSAIFKLAALSGVLAVLTALTMLYGGGP